MMPIVKKDCMISMPFIKFLWLENELDRLWKLHMVPKPIFCDECKKLKEKIKKLEDKL